MFYTSQLLLTRTAKNANEYYLWQLLTTELDKTKHLWVACDGTPRGP